MNDLFSRAWDTLDSFRQAYPENWHEDDEQLMKDLTRAELKLSGVKLKWVGLTQQDIDQAWEWAQKDSRFGVNRIDSFAKAIEDKLKEKNT